MSRDHTREMLTEIASYYSEKLHRYGETHSGVDWSSESSQLLRFEQVTKIIGLSEAFSINDVGCGYGALYDYLTRYYRNFLYYGCDVSEPMILAAQSRSTGLTEATYCVGNRPPSVSDYGIASGIFNVRLRRSDDEWKTYLKETLDVLNETSTRGFAFNCLTSYSDIDRKRDYLFYADPCEVFDYCKRRYSRQVALLHDYGLYEFTILVRKEL